MFERFDLRPLARPHFQSLIDPGRRRISFGTTAIIFLLPLAVGILGGWAVPIPGAAPADASGGAPAPASSAASAVFTALPGAAGTLVAGFLAAFVLLMNLRIKLDDSPQLPRTPAQLRSISTAAMSSLYLTTVSGSALIVSLCLAIFGAPLAAIAPLAFRALVGLVLGLFTHILVNAITVLRRVAGAYYVLYKGEIRRVPVRGVPEHDKRAS
ncbi:hypothetical protein FDF08_09585 [Micrococcus luteus]|nr:hypothetical protein FDF08_09585 [Micrococcus luteus]